jgi:hypothetical protein
MLRYGNSAGRVLLKRVDVERDRNRMNNRWAGNPQDLVESVGWGFLRSGENEGEETRRRWDTVPCLGAQREFRKERRSRHGERPRGGS